MPSTKNILLVNPWIYDFTAYDFWLKPLGLLYIASILKKSTDFRLSFIDCLDRFHPLLPKKMKTRDDGRGPFPKEEVTKPHILKGIPRKYSRYGIPVSLFLHDLERIPPPDLVLMTCTMTYWYPGVRFAVELIREKFGSVPVILGGIYATLMPEHALENTGVDGIVQGPGEKKIFSVLRNVFGEQPIHEFGMSTLDDIPWPSFEYLRNRKNLPVLTSRGCPLECSFCGVSLLCENFDQRTPSSVVAEIEYFSQTFSARNLAFYDDALLLNKQDHIIPILEEVIKRKLSVAFHTPNGLHIREIDFELASLFQKANFRSLYLSQESFEEGVLEKASSKVSTSDLEAALNNLEKSGYNRHQVNVYLMVGLPGQDASSVRESINYVRRLGARPRLAYFSTVPGTREWHLLVEKRVISPGDDPLFHNKLVFPYLKGDMSIEEFESLRKLLNN